MSIEESVMVEAKTSGGIGHGALYHEDALGSWFLFIEHTSKVSEDYAGSICRQTDSTSYKHPDTAMSYRHKDQPLKLLLTFLRRIILLIQT